MTERPDSTGHWEIAHDARAKGLVAIPCHPGTKIPAVSWKRWQAEMPPLKLHEEWFADTRVNIAIICTGLVIFDCDDPALAELVIEHCGATPHQVRTPRGGIHLGYRKRKGVAVTNQVKIKGLALDARTDGGLEMIPNSATEHGRYEWLGDGLKPIADLPVARIGWTRERTRKQSSVLVSAAVTEATDRRSLLYRGRKYVDRFPRCVSGENGHTVCFVACLKIVRFARLLGGGPDEAWQLALYYNATKCDPEWSARELQHKFADAQKKAQ